MNIMETTMIPGQLQKPIQVHKADSGAIRFEMIYTRVSNVSAHPFIALISKECPHEQMYSIQFNHDSSTICVNSPEGEIYIMMPVSLIPISTQEFWLTWCNDKICMGLKNETPFLMHPLNSKENSIGFLKFEVSTNINWDVKCPAFAIRPLRYKHIEGGKLKWVKMSDNKLPPDAFIGGYENEQPLYIARAKHRGSLCPGKYVPSKQCALIPWGFREHKKNNFEILCGFNAIWIKCKDNYVPENAFVAGKSEVNAEHLYIGRAMIDTDLIVGKVHMLYKTCYLPYKDSEVERYKYEILVRADIPNRGVTGNKNCCMNPMKAIQPCI